MSSSPVPHLFELQNKLDELDRNGYDIHTFNLVTNGQRGGWDVTIEATDSDLNDHRWSLWCDAFGNHLQPIEALV